MGWRWPSCSLRAGRECERGGRLSQGLGRAAGGWQRGGGRVRLQPLRSGRGCGCGPSPGQLTRQSPCRPSRPGCPFCDRSRAFLVDCSGAPSPVPHKQGALGQSQRGSGNQPCLCNSHSAARSRAMRAPARMQSNNPERSYVAPHFPTFAVGCTRTAGTARFRPHTCRGFCWQPSGPPPGFEWRAGP